MLYVSVALKLAKSKINIKTQKIICLHDYRKFLINSFFVSKFAKNEFVLMNLAAKICFVSKKIIRQNLQFFTLLIILIVFLNLVKFKRETNKTNFTDFC